MPSDFFFGEKSSWFETYLLLFLLDLKLIFKTLNLNFFTNHIVSGFLLMCRHILRFKSLDSISGAPLASVNGILGTANSICEKFRHKYMIDDKLLDLKYYHDPFFWTVYQHIPISWFIFFKRLRPLFTQWGSPKSFAFPYVCHSAFKSCQSISITVWKVWCFNFLGTYNLLPFQNS